MNYYNKYKKYKQKYCKLKQMNGGSGFNLNDIITKFVDVKEFYNFMSNNTKYAEQFNVILTTHRKHTALFTDIVKEHDHNKTNNTYVILLLLNDNIIATGRVSCENEIGFVSMIHVTASMRGIGVCDLLIKNIIKNVKNIKNIKKLCLSVDVDNTPAIKCYKNNNFQFYDFNDSRDYYKMILDVRNGK